METLASAFWARDPCDLSDLGEKPSSVWDSQCVFNSSPPAGLMWTEQLSPHLQRNKQLQDTLLQREEELARLQEENNKLREFLNSSFVRNLEKKAKLKRNLMFADDGPFQSCSHQLLTSQQVSKRVCRNLTAEFCSESSETSPSSEPNLDLWVLRTLGLKDRDTIDTSSSSSSSPGYSLSSLVYDAAVIKHPAYWSPLRVTRTPSQDKIHFSPAGERLPFSPILSSTPVMNQQCPISPAAGSQPPATPQTPRCRTDLAFSMSLSPSSSVKTHSFPQGQAFVRKDTEGRWNFTWVPRQGP
uniref:Geminin coiled-coil domain-containing protein 1 n=1 Tax=Dicentrarchus labrax TaxID=13489 RepID=A0A8C4DAY3_DICLA